MSMTEAQRRRVLRRARVKWNEAVDDPRDSRGMRHPHRGLLGLMMAAFACGRSTLRRMEDLSEDLGPSARRALRLPRKISDSTLYRLLEAQKPRGFRETLQGQVRQLIEEKAITRDRFPLGVVSFDGKTTWTSTRREIPGAKASTSGAVPVWSFTSLRAALTSSDAAPCLDQELISAKQGESPAFRVLLPRVCREFGGQFQVVTGDAGLMCRENAMLVVGHRKHYLFALKGNHGKAHALAVDAFTDAPVCRARTEEQSHGKTIIRELFTCAASKLPDLGIFGAQQLWCVRQTSWPAEGPPTVETRYFVSSLPAQMLAPTQQLALVRLHWGIENHHNWTMDEMLAEDAVAPCQANREAIEVVCWLRLLGYNLLAAWRARAPKKDRLPLTWARTMELLRDLMVVSLPAETFATAV